MSRASWSATSACALGPLLVGLLHDVSGGWTLPLLFLLAVALAAAIPATTLARPAFVEDELVGAAP
ncbi:hypothetical protein [Cryptosporangium sp. NPDC051539]|uniref:hypothetical protein n=1 Tax=Cryptosporangium sp. NPDC051539 TaxID=3363962 RepID=UPI0037A221D6